MKKILLSVWIMLLCSMAMAQEHGVQIQDVERIPMGDGTYVFRHSKGEKNILKAGSVLSSVAASILSRTSPTDG